MSGAQTAVGMPGPRRFKPYPAYKDSGVEWLGGIPAHWEVKPFKALLARNDSGVWGEDFADDGVVVLRSTEQTVDGRWRIEDPARRRLTAREASESRLEVGDLVTTKSSGSDLHIGKTAIVDESVAALKCSFSNFMQRLRVATPQEPRHYWYLLNCPVAREQLVFLSSTTTGLGNLNGSILGAIRIPVAPDDEQRAIAAFLDRETARNDALVAKKERLIELLQEKRTALITRAVTKGLDPTVPMKDSGVEWLGEIPAGWTAKRLKFVAAYPIKNGIGEAGAYDDPEWPRYVRITDIAGPRELREDTFKSLPPELAREAPFEVGDLLLAAVGATFGKSYLHIRDCGPVCFAGYMVRFSPGRKVEPSFAAYWTESAAYWALVQSRVVQATIQNFSAAKYKDLALPLPSVPEQRAIAGFLDRETARIDALVAKVREAIERLKELRTALISAAVTGKIDVREEVA